MADLSKITLPSGTTYDIKDAVARELIEDLSSYTKFLGVTTTELEDGDTTNPIMIDGESVTAESGNIVTYESTEFIFNGTSWQAFGDLSGLGSLAFKDSASGDGTVAVPSTYTTTITPVAKDVSVTGTTSGSVSVTKSNVSVSQAVSGEATYTPSGSVSAPEISVKTAGGTTSVTGISSVGSMPTYTVSNETLTITGGSTPTAAAAVDCKTSDPEYEASAPSFTGTGARLITDSEVATAATFTGSSITSTGSYTPAVPTATTTTNSTETKTVSVTVS